MPKLKGNPNQQLAYDVGNHCPGWCGARATAGNPVSKLEADGGQAGPHGVPVPASVPPSACDPHLPRSSLGPLHVPLQRPRSEEQLEMKPQTVPVSGLEETSSPDERGFRTRRSKATAQAGRRQDKQTRALRVPPVNCDTDSPACFWTRVSFCC